MVVSTVWYFHHYLGKWNPIWRTYFSNGLVKNHHLEIVFLSVLSTTQVFYWPGKSPFTLGRVHATGGSLTPRWHVDHGWHHVDFNEKHVGINLIKKTSSHGDWGRTKHPPRWHNKHWHHFLDRFLNRKLMWQWRSNLKLFSSMVNLERRL